MAHQLVFPPEQFGAKLGEAPGGVPIFSSHYPSADKREYPDRESYQHYLDGIYMGYKWQCVEFARRWLYLNHGCVFDDIPMAHDIFRLRSLRRLADGTSLPLRAFRNGSPRLPEPGCLLIWDSAGEFEITGHVAVVTEVLESSIRFAEQNIEHCLLPPGQHWCRELPVSRTGDGGYFVEPKYARARILGWMIQTDDDTHAERSEEADPALLQLQAASAPRSGAHLQAWLDPERRADAAFIKFMGGHRLAQSSGDLDPYRYFRMSQTARAELVRATNELHHMFMHATQAVLGDDALLQRFCIPRSLWPRLRSSWERRRGQAVTGRLDFCVTERGIKIYEYNIDSASCHMEAGRVQGLWARHFGVNEGEDAGAPLWPALVSAWKDLSVEGVLHIMQDHVEDETYHAHFMRSAAEEAGLRCKVIRGLNGLGWNDAGDIVDADGEVIRYVWKTWAWETALDQIREQCDDDDRFPELRTQHAGDPPRLVDVLLRPAITVFEPFWTLIPSNKAILPVMREIFPEHPYLLDTEFELTAALRSKGYVSKPIVGRCGANISLFDRHARLLNETEGRFDDRDQVYQELWKLPEIDGLRVQVSSFTVRGRYAGLCTRVDTSLIISGDSDCLPLRIVDDRTHVASRS